MTAEDIDSKIQRMFLRVNSPTKLINMMENISFAMQVQYKT